MQILAIETSGTTGSIAALVGERIVADLALDPLKRSAQTLAPGIMKLLAEVGWKAADVRLVAVGIGPGSFTGLRLGVMTAKTFAYATGAKIIGISTLAAIAAAVGDAAQIAVASDAQRGEVYSGRFQRNHDGGLIAVQPAQIIAVDTWLASLRPGEIATGPALEKLAAKIPTPFTSAPREVWLPNAGHIGLLAAGRAARDDFDDVWSLAPLYLRRSAAEEKWDAQHQS